MRLIQFLSLIFLLLLLMLSTLIYVNDDFPEIGNFLHNQKIIPQIGNYYTSLLNWMHQSKLPDWTGIGLVLVLISIYLTALSWATKGKRLKSIRWSKRMVLTVVISSIAIFFFIYFLPDDTVRLGKFLTIKRGPRDQFLVKCFHIILIVLTAHMYFFLFLQTYFCLFFKTKKPIKRYGVKE